MRWVLLVVCACHPASATTEPSPFDLPRYAGVTRCGPAAPPPLERPAPPMPAREPMMYTVPPRIDVEGGLTADTVSREVQAHAPMFRRCFLQLRARDEHAGGFRVHLGFAILENGTVAGIEVHGVDPTMNECLCDEATRLRFAPSERSIVSYPLEFGG